MSTPDSPPPAGWYPDPQDDAAERWWNGLAWTASTRAPEPEAMPETVVPAYAEPSYDQAAAIAPAYYAPAYGQPGGYAVASAPVGYPGSSPAVIQAYPNGGQVMPYGYAPSYAPMYTGAPDVRGMADAIKSVFRQYAGFQGRATRSEFWYWYLFNALLVAGVIITVLIGVLLPPVLFLGGLGYFALILWAIASFLPTLALEIRRLRDAALPWPLIFLSFVPFGGIALLILWAQPTKG